VNDGLDTLGSLSEPEPAQSPRRADHLARILLIPLALALVAVVLVFYVAFSALQVEGQSMWPTLHTQDRLLLTHSYPAAQRGDIVVIRLRTDTGETEIIKRVIALPGDSVEIRADVAYVNGKAEPRRGQVIVPELAVDVAAQVIPDGTLYVMGDNRAVSEDSRYIGTVPLSGIVGKAVAVFSPIDRVRLLR